MSSLLDARGQEWTRGEEGTRWPLNIHSNAYGTSLIVKTGPGKLYGFSVYNSNAATQYILLFDAAAVPASGSIPCFPYPVATASALFIGFGDTGRSFDTGCVLVNSSTLLTLTIGSADCYFDAQYL